MPTEPVSTFSTDAIAHLYRWDEMEGWRLLLEHLELTEGFSLVVVLAPDEWGVALARQQLAGVLGGPGTLVRVQFDPAAGIGSLAEALLSLPQLSSDVKVVWVDSDPASPEQLAEREQDWQLALSRLNRYRNTLQARFACTLIVALPSRMQTLLARAAPDIWSIRSGVFRIEPPGGSLPAVARLPAEEWSGIFDGERPAAGDPAETLAQVEKLRGKPGREVLLARLLQRAGNQARARFQWRLAEDCLRDAYSLMDAAGWGDPLLQLEIATDLARVYADSAQYGLAERYSRLAREVAEEHFGAEHPLTALAYSNLAQTLQDTNRLADAEILMRQALAIDQRTLGTGHPTVARDLNNLAQLLQAMNRHEQAEPLMRRALAIDEQAYGGEHPLVATDLNNLARLLQDTNRLDEAEPLMRRALAIDEETFGPNHPMVAINLSNLAGLLQSTNRMEEAESLMRQALAILEATFGPNHPRTATTLNNLAQLLQVTNRLDEAEPLMRRALAIDQAVYGPDHPTVAIRMHNLAHLLWMTSRPAEAEPLMRQALAIFERSLGAEHPHTLAAESNLRSLLEERI